MRGFKLCIAVFVCLLSNSFASTLKNINHFVFPDYFTFRDTSIQTEIKGLGWLSRDDLKDYALWRFDDLDLPIEEKSLAINFSFVLKPEDIEYNKPIFIHVIYTNPKNGEFIRKKVELTIDNINNELKGKDNIPIDFFSERGSIIVRVERADKDSPKIGVEKKFVMIDNIYSLVDEDYLVAGAGVLFPTANTSKLEPLTWGPFREVRDKLGIMVLSVFIPRKEVADDNDLSEVYLGMDVRWQFIEERNITPALSAGVMSFRSLVHETTAGSSALYGVYGVVTKNVSGILTSSLGFLRGDVLNMFFYDNSAYDHNDFTKINNFLFTSIGVRISPVAVLKFETGYDLKEISSFVIWGFSVAAFKNMVSFDLGLAMTEIEDVKNKNLFVVTKLRL